MTEFVNICATVVKTKKLVHIFAASCTMYAYLFILHSIYIFSSETHYINKMNANSFTCISDLSQQRYTPLYGTIPRSHTVHFVYVASVDMDTTMALKCKLYLVSAILIVLITPGPPWSPPTIHTCSTCNSPMCCKRPSTTYIFVVQMARLSFFP